MLISLVSPVRDFFFFLNVISNTDNFIICNVFMHQKNLTYLGSRKRFLSPTFPMYPMFLIRREIKKVRNAIS